MIERQISDYASPIHVAGKPTGVPVSVTSADLHQSHTGSARRCGCLQWRNRPQRTLVHTRSWCFCSRSPRGLYPGSTNGLRHVCVSLGSCSTPVRSKWSWLTRVVIVACGLRLLGPLERQIVMNILWLDASIPASTMSSWVVREGKKLVFRIISCGNPLRWMFRC